MIIGWELHQIQENELEQISYKSNWLGTCVNLLAVSENYSTQYLGINSGWCGPSIQVEMHWYVRY